MVVTEVSPRISAAEYSLRKEEVGTAIYDIVKKYIPLPNTGEGCIIHKVQTFPLPTGG